MANKISQLGGKRFHPKQIRTLGGIKPGTVCTVVEARMGPKKIRGIILATPLSYYGHPIILYYDMNECRVIMCSAEDKNIVPYRNKPEGENWTSQSYIFRNGRRVSANKVDQIIKEHGDQKISFRETVDQLLSFPPAIQNPD